MKSILPIATVALFIPFIAGANAATTPLDTASTATRVAASSQMVPQRPTARVTAPGFELNNGQLPADWSMLVRAANYSAVLNAKTVRLEIPGSAGASRKPLRGPDPNRPVVSHPDGLSIELSFVGADKVALVGEGLRNTVAHYFLGQNSDEHVANVPVFNQARAKDIYPGIDLVYLIDDGNLRYDFIVAPGMSAQHIELAVDGADALALKENGALAISINGRQLIQQPPLVFQEVNGQRVEIAASYTLRDNGLVGFDIGEYDSSSALVIDPTLDYATYFGGSGYDTGSQVALDSQGNYVLCGETTSLAFATPGSIQATYAGSRDLYVAKISAGTNEVEFVTYFGGRSSEQCNRVRLDNADNIVVVGYTYSSDFPTFNAVDSSFEYGGFNNEGFVTKLASDGAALVFSSYLGGADLDSEEETGFLYGRETVSDVFVDAQGNVFVTGNTSAADFPATHQLSGRMCGEDTPFAAQPFVSDQFITKLSPSGSLEFSTCFGGTARDAGRGVVVAADGTIVTVGFSRSSDYPVSAGALDTGSSGGPSYSGVVTVLNSDASAVLRTARFGGSGHDYFERVALDSAGNVAIAGHTWSEDFPVSVDALQTEYAGDSFSLGFLNPTNGIVLRLDDELGEIGFSTYFGGDRSDLVVGIEVDSEDRIVFAMRTSSTDLLVEQPLQTAKGKEMGALRSLEQALTGANAIAIGRMAPGPNYIEYTLDNIAIARNGLNDLYIIPFFGDPVYVGPLGAEAFDSRAIATFDVTGDGWSDILVGNYNAPNHLYINQSNGSYTGPVTFGAADSKTVGVAARDSGNGQMLIIEVNENQQNYRYVYESNLIHSPVPFGTANSASVDLGPKSDVGNFGNELVEAVTPDQVFVHTFEDGNVVSQARTFPGVDIAGVDHFQLDYTAAMELLVADRNGGIQIVYGDVLSAPPVLLDTQDEPVVAVTGVRGWGVVSAHADGLRFFPFDDTQSFGPAQFVPSASPIAVVAGEPASSSTPIVAAGGPGIEDGFSFVGAEDIYVGVLSSDGRTLQFGTYLGGAGHDHSDGGLTLAQPGQMVVSGVSSTLNFPTVAPVQDANAGNSDAVLLRIAYTTVDQDGDGVVDNEDNCTSVSNSDQRDSNADGFGNVCDADLNNDGITNVFDLGLLRAVFFAADEDADLNGDGIVNVVDLGMMRTLFFLPPGPSGLVSMD